MSNKYKFHNTEGLYFVSFSVINWVDVFTRSDYKDILIRNLSYCQQYKSLEIYAWCIMTSHVHLLIRAKEGRKLSDILRDYKKHTSKLLITEIKNNPKESRREWMLAFFEKKGGLNSNNSIYQFWQQDNHPIELWSNAVIEQKLDYIHNNPVEAGFVELPEEYLYSSARDYTGMKGLLDIELI